MPLVIVAGGQEVTNVPAKGVCVAAEDAAGERSASAKSASASNGSASARRRARPATGSDMETGPPDELSEEGFHAPDVGAIDRLPERLSAPVRQLTYGAETAASKRPWPLELTTAS